MVKEAFPTQQMAGVVPHLQDKTSSTQLIPGVAPYPYAGTFSVQLTPGVEPLLQYKGVTCTQLKPGMMLVTQKSRWSGRVLRLIPVSVYLDNQANILIKLEGHIWQTVRLSKKEIGSQLSQRQSGSRTMR